MVGGCGWGCICDCLLLMWGFWDSGLGVCYLFGLIVWIDCLFGLFGLFVWIVWFACLDCFSEMGMGKAKLR